jgi:hypothetical protein
VVVDVAHELLQQVPKWVLGKKSEGVREFPSTVEEWDLQLFIQEERAPEEGWLCWRRGQVPIPTF